MCVGKNSYEYTSPCKMKSSTAQLPQCQFGRFYITVTVVTGSSSYEIIWSVFQVA